MANNTKVVTGMNTRLSYAHLFEPVSINGGAEKYSVSVLIPKDDKATIEKIEKNGKVSVNYGSFKTQISGDELERI